VSSSGLHRLCRGAVGELWRLLSPRVARSGLTAVCSGRFAARPSAEPER